MLEVAFGGKFCLLISEKAEAKLPCASVSQWAHFATSPAPARVRLVVFSCPCRDWIQSRGEGNLALKNGVNDLYDPLLFVSSTPLSQLLSAFAAPLSRRLLNLSVIRKALFFLFCMTVLSTIAKFGKMCSILHQELRLNTWRGMENCRVACQNMRR